MRPLLLLFFLIRTLIASAQPCGDMNTAVLSLHLQWGKDQEIEVDEVVLCDAWGNPVFHQDHFSYGGNPEMVKGKVATFIPNTKKARKKLEWPHVPYKALDVLGNYILPYRNLQSTSITLFPEKPSYFVRVHYRWKGEEKTSFTPISLDESINLCANHLLGDIPPEAKKIYFKDGQAYRPKKIELDVIQQLVTPIKHLRLGLDTLVVDGIAFANIHSFIFGSLLEDQIETPLDRPIQMHAVRIRDHTTVNFFERTDAPYPDLRIAEEDSTSPQGFVVKRYQHYRYLAEKGLYALIPNLCRGGNEWYDPGQRKWFRKIFRDSEFETIIDTQELRMGRWEVVASDRRKKPLPYTTDYRCVRWENGQVHVLPTTLTTGEGGYYSVRDTFRLYNTCTQKIIWQPPMNPNPATYAPEVEGRQSAEIHVHDSVWMSPNNIIEQMRFIEMPMGNGSTHRLRVDYFMADSKLEVKSKNGTRIFQKEWNGQVSEQLVTTEDLFPLAKGKVLSTTNARVGTWKRWGPNQRLQDTIYSKQVSVTIANLQQNQKLSLFVNGEAVDYFQQGSVIYFYVTSDATEFRIEAPGYWLKQNIYYELIQELVSYHLYLIGDDDDYYISYGACLPVHWLDRYVIQWHYLPNVRFDPNGAIKELQQKYPEIEFFEFSPFQGYYQFTITDPKNHERLLNALLNEPMIKGVSRVANYPSYETFFDDYVSMDLPGLPLEEIKTLCERHNFNPESYRSVSGYAELRYRGNIYGEEMLKDIRLLQEALGVQGISPNWYMEIELDNE